MGREPALSRRLFVINAGVAGYGVHYGLSNEVQAHIDESAQ